MAPAPPAALAATYTPDSTAVGGSLAGTALLGLVPLATFFLLLMWAKRSALQSAVGALVVALLVGVLGMGTPVQLGLLSASQGLVFGLFPVMLIVVAAIWFYELTVVSNRFEDLRRSFSAVGRGDLRVQAMLIAFCFGGLLEALAGFGAPVAITAAMLMALGLPPLRAAVTVLVANTAPVAFGAMAIPITTAGNLTGIPPEEIAAVVGRQSPVLALFVPLLLLFLVDGTRGLRQLWPIALVTGAVFAVAQFWCSSHFAYELTDVVAALAGFAAAVLMLRFWKPHDPEDQRSKVEAEPLTLRRVNLAVLPYVLVIVIFALAKLNLGGLDMPKILGVWNIELQWPGLYGSLLAPDGSPMRQRRLQARRARQPRHAPHPLRPPGHARLPVHPRRAVPDDRADGAGRRFYHTLNNMKVSIATVATVLSISYVMNQSGQTVAIGTWLAAAAWDLRAALAEPGLAGDGRHRVRHLGQRALRDASADRRTEGGDRSDAAGRGEHLRWGGGEAGQSAESDDCCHCRRAARE